MEKRRKLFARVLLVLLTLFVLVVTNVLVDVWSTKLHKVSVHTNKLDKGKSLRVLQISDVHDKKSASSNKQLVNLVKEAQPDIVVFTGDLIDDNTTELDNAYALVEAIASLKHKMYFVTGNHEWRGGKAEELKKGLKARGVVILDNKNEIIEIRDEGLNICGVEDWTSGQQDLSQALKGLDSSVFTVMLAHDPWIIYDYKDFVPDLTLSGHTHGGQIRLPFVGAVVAPGQELFPKLDKEFFNINEDKQLYIDSGVGTSVIPLRFLNRSQVTLITIEN